jgi:arylsulfatase A-like enzyme
VKIPKLGHVACVLLGLGLGYVAATGNLSLFKAAAPAEAVAATATQPEETAAEAAQARLLAHNAKVAAQAAKDGKKPNIVVIMGDDVGCFNIGAYHQGIMSGRTPNLDLLASQGVRFTDYYAEASCTAGRANFITGQIPLRTGLTTVGQAGGTVGMPSQAPTLAAVLRALGYFCGQFGKNHLGDLNMFLPTVHGFHEFFGYLYHLDAMSDPYWPSYPRDPAFRAAHGPRNMLHCTSSDVDDPTVEKRWGRVGKQVVKDAGPLPPKRMETVDDEILKHALAFMDKSKKENKPFFVWLNPTRMHIFTFLSQKYKAMMNSETNFGLYEAGMAQLDDIVGAVLRHLTQMGEADNTIVIFTTDNGAEVFTWPDGGMTPFRGTKGMATEGGFRVPCIVKWPGKFKGGTVENGIFSGLDWFPTLAAAAGAPDIVEELKKGKKIGDVNYKVHLDGHNQLPLLEGKGKSKRNEVWYFVEAKIGAVRIGDMKFNFIDQPQGWPGPHLNLNMPRMVNIRQDPFERTPTEAWGYGNDFMAREFWRFVLVQQQVEKLGKSFIDFPPMQRPASFNLDAVAAQIKAAIARRGQ